VAPAPVSSNRLLQSLSAPGFARLIASCTRVALHAGEVVSLPAERPSHVYFPETAVFSLIVVMMKGGGAVESATVGHEGMVGLATCLGDGAMTSRGIVQIAGNAQQMTALALRRAVAADPALAVVFGRYTQAFINQVAQSVACNRLHTIEQRCARWLLMTHDRVGGGDAFDLTQEFLSYMLGVRRAGVSRASGALQNAGIIRYRRGHLSVLDRSALEHVSCECYGATRDDYARLFT
jgi:CRP-like cAMP-binding protein